MLEKVDRPAAMLSCKPTARGREVVTRQVHTLENAGSSPAPATRTFRIFERVLAAVILTIAFTGFFLFGLYLLAYAQEFPNTVNSQTNQIIPEPDLSLQRCWVAARGDVMTIRCDSSNVCPHGWHLHTDFLNPLTAQNIQNVLGYGDAREVVNSCVPSAAPGGITLENRRYEAGVGAEIAK